MTGPPDTPSRNIDFESSVSRPPPGERREGADPVAVFEGQRPRLFGLAYRMLGSASEAEDVVQDAYLRWSGADQAAVAAPAAWLTTAVVNLCRNQLTSARARRERYVGTWLPEPVLTSDGTLGPLETAEQRELVSLALLTLLEQLTPPERAVFVLRESFGHSHREIAQILGTSEAGCRQLHHRARQRIGDRNDRFEAGPGDRKHRFEPEPGEWERLVDSFFVAAWQGDVAALERLLADGATYWSDGGGKAPVARRPVTGRARLARFIAKLFPRYAELPDFGRAGFSAAEVNGEPAVLARSDGELIAVLVPEIADGKITALRVAANPDKLGFAARQARQAG